MKNININASVDDAIKQEGINFANTVIDYIAIGGIIIAALVLMISVVLVIINTDDDKKKKAKLGAVWSGLGMVILGTISIAIKSLLPVLIG